MITAHGKKALLVKGDYHPAEAYAGVERVATVERTEIVAVQEGEGAPTPGVDLYIDEVIVSTSGGVTFDRPLQPGTYTFTARVVSEKENTRCLMLIGGTWYSVTPNGELETFTLTLTKSDSNLTLYSAGSYDDSLGYSATWSDIHITSGNIRPIHGIDRVVVDCTDGTCHTVMLPHTSYGGYIDWARRKYVETHDILYLPVAEMCNSERNPGWSVGEQLRRFLPAGFNAAVSGVISNCTSYVYANTMYTNNILFVASSKISQSAYLQNYPDLVFEFCLPLVEPVEYDVFLPNSAQKYAGWHDEAHEVADEPVVFTGTYNDQVGIHAVGTGYQETMAATSSALGSLVQAEIPAGQPLDVRVDISAKEMPPTTNLMQRTIPAIFENSVTGGVLLTARGAGFQQTFDATEAVSGQLVQMKLPAGQPLDVRIEIEAKQEGMGNPTPDNVRPICGVDNLTITVCGRNLLNPEKVFEGHYTAPGVKRPLAGWGISTEKIRVNGDFVWICSNEQIPDEIIYSTWKDDGTWARAALVDNNYIDIRGIKYLALEHFPVGYDVSAVQLTLIEEDPYTAYQGIEHTMNLPVTSYGGYIDWTREKFVQTHSTVTYDGSENGWYDYKDGVAMTYWTKGGLAPKRRVYNAPMNNDICDIATQSQNPDKYIPNEFHFITYTPSHDEWIVFQCGMGKNDFIAYLREHPVTVCYEILNPIEYDLADLPKLFASGDNITTVYSDGTSVTVSGMAMPGPAHSSALEADDGAVHSRGKNLADMSVYGDAYQDSRLLVTSWGTAPDNHNVRLSELCPSLRVGDTFVMSMENSLGDVAERCFWWLSKPRMVIFRNTPYVCTQEMLDSVVGWYRATVEPVIPEYYYNVQVEIGEEATAYEPYHAQTQITLPPLRAIPDGSGGYIARDELRPVIGRPGWYDVVRRVKEYVIDGNENWMQNNHCVYIVKNGECLYGSLRGACTHYVGVQEGWHLSYGTVECGVGFGVIGSTNNAWIAITDERFSQVEEYVDWFKSQFDSGNPVKVWYVAAKPTTERVYLGDLHSYPGRTALTIHGEHMPEIEAKVLVRAEDGLGQKEPGNPCTITGTDSVTLTLCGRNLLDVSDLLDGYVRSDGTIEIVDWYRCTKMIHVVPGEKVYISKLCNSTSVLRHVVFYNSDGKRVDSHVEPNAPEIVDIPECAMFIRVNIDPGLIGTEKLSIMMQTGEGADYEGKTHQITLPETCYGGYIDWARGVYVQTHQHYVFDDPRIQLVLSSQMENGLYRYYLNDIIGYPQCAAIKCQYGLCSHFKTLFDFDQVGIAFGNTNAGHVYFITTMTADELKDFLLDNAVEIVYPIFTPIEHSLSNTQPLTASSDGITTAWSNAASMTMAGAAVPGPFHPSDLEGSEGKVISCGRNLFDKAMFAKYMGEKFGSEVIVDGKTCNRFFTNAAYNLMMPLVCEKNEQYAFSCMAKASAGRALVRIYYSDGTKGDVNAATDISEGWNRITFVTAPGKTVVGIGGNGSILAADLYLADVMFERGAKAGTYVPFEQTVVTLPLLRAIPGTDVHDELRPVNGKPGWYDVIRKVAEHTFTGEEGYTSDPAQRSDGYNYIYMSFPDKKVNGSVACNHLPAGNFGSRNNVIASAVVLGFVLADDLTGVGPTDDKAARVAKIHAVIESAYNKGDPYVVWYELAQPAVERVYLGPLRTYPRYTGIRATGDLLPTITASAKISD